MQTGIVAAKNESEVEDAASDGPGDVQKAKDEDARKLAVGHMDGQTSGNRITTIIWVNR